MILSELEQNLLKYAKLITEVGINVQPGQKVIIYASVTQKKLVDFITSNAYQLGAEEVLIEWHDIEATKQLLLNASVDTLKRIPQYISDKWRTIADERVSRISIISDDPNALVDIPAEKISVYQNARTLSQRPIMEVTTNNDISWLVVAAADVEWAELVYPNLKGMEAVNCLWREIFKTTLVDRPDPIIAWKEKVKDLSLHAKWLNDQNFDHLKYTAPGTDLTVGLPEGHIWEAADSTDAQGNVFVANIPTEEVFTAPDNRRIDGTLSSTKPLSYSGKIIEGIHLTFRNGRVVEGIADQGNETLQHILDTDDGTRSLGEISLVPDDSPISNSNITFFSTLFDENASDHVALGEAYPFTIKGGTNWNVDELRKHGMNVSRNHVDFMIGSKQMNIDGIKKDGTVVPIFRDGNWA
ncbi:peptidase [Pediococcus claussenii]|uniref:aminopeptidase n=1 Tax=Pediococcus claussenii TaxID=187452 RepID=UPI00081A8056|nr:aminopeptidase [Pediococcus claussenii]ANZ68997.1 peptidase [Pediococcus claussenii]